MNNVVYVDFTQKNDARRFEEAQKKLNFTNQSRELYNRILEKLTRKQFNEIRLDDPSYLNRAFQIKRVTSNKKIHDQCDQLIALIRDYKQSKVN